MSGRSQLNEHVRLQGQAHCAMNGQKIASLLTGKFCHQLALTSNNCNNFKAITDPILNVSNRCCTLDDHYFNNGSYNDPTDEPAKTCRCSSPITGDRLKVKPDYVLRLRVKTTLHRCKPANTPCKHSASGLPRASLCITGYRTRRKIPCSHRGTRLPRASQLITGYRTRTYIPAECCVDENNI